MSEKPEDKDLYNVLRSSIDNMESEPSEHFWNKAYDSILQKEAPGVVQKASGWKRATIALAFTVAALIGYSIYTNHQVKDVEQRIAALERNQLSYASTAAYTSGNSMQALSSNNSSTVNNTVKAQKNTGISAGNNNNTVIASERTEVVASVSRNIKPFSKKTNYTAPENQEVASQQETPSLPELNATPDTLNVPPVREIALAKPKSFSKSRFSVSAFLAPAITMQNIKSKSSDATTASMIRSGENQAIASGFGITVGYDLSAKCTIELGCAYQTTAFSISPTTLKPIAGEEGPYYSLATTSGTIYIPAASSTPGNVNGTAELSTISIPLKLKYNFYNGSRLRLYACAGGSVNILVSNSANINYLNQASESEEEIMANNMDGTKDLSFSCLIGLGAEYKIERGVSAYAEPMYQQAVTPQCSNSSISVYPAYFDVAAGLRFHF